MEKGGGEEGRGEKETDMSNSLDNLLPERGGGGEKKGERVGSYTLNQSREGKRGEIGIWIIYLVWTKPFSNAKHPPLIRMALPILEEEKGEGGRSRPVLITSHIAEKRRGRKKGEEKS